MPGEFQPNVSLSEYRAWSAYGSSDLKAFRIGPPAVVPWRRAHPDEPSEAMQLGTAAHCAILEPAAFDARFAHKPAGMNFSTKEGKAWRDDPCRAAMTILSHDEWEQVGAIVHAFHSKALAIESLRAATAVEASIRWNDPDTGLPLKARPDYFEQGGFTTDLKITRHAKTSGIDFRAYVEGWANQGALYWAGLNECGFKVKGARLVLINPEPPQQFRVFCVELKQDALGMLHLENERTIKGMAECEASGVWPGSPDEWMKIDLPSIASAGVVADWGDDEDMVPETAKRRA